MKSDKKYRIHIPLLTLTWLFFSPLFLFFSIKWGKPKLIARTILTIISPFTLIILFIVIFSVGSYYYKYLERGSRAEIEEKTGIEFPRFRTIKKRQLEGRVSFQGDFQMTRTVKIDTAFINDLLYLIENVQPINSSSSDILTKEWKTNNEGQISFYYLDENEFLDFTIENETGVMTMKYGTY